MLPARQHQFVATSKIHAAPGCGRQVDTFGRPAHEHNFAWVRGVDKACDRGSRPFVFFCGAARQRMERSRGVRVVSFVELGNRGNYGSWALRGRSAIKIGQGLAVDGLRQRWKIGTPGARARRFSVSLRVSLLANRARKECRGWSVGKKFSSRRDHTRLLRSSKRSGQCYTKSVTTVTCYCNVRSHVKPSDSARSSTRASRRRL